MNRYQDNDHITPYDGQTGLRAIMLRSLTRLVRRPLYWGTIFFLPLFSFLMLCSLMENGLPEKVPAAIVDRDNSELSRQMTRTLGNMQMVDLKMECESYTSARDEMQSGNIFGYFLIPENFQADLLAGRSPVITMYINMTYYVPGSLLFKTFKTTALYTKAGIITSVASQAGVSGDVTKNLIRPVNIVLHPLHNPSLNYAIYLCNSFLPCVLQLMIMLVTCFTLGQEIKYGTSRCLLEMARGSMLRALAGELIPQTIIWWVMAIFMESWLFRWNGFPMNGSWFWLTLSELMFVVAAQSMAVFFFGIFPNLRLSLSVSALTGILSFSIAAFSFPVESMYPAMGIFSYLMPIRYNFLIYIDQALNGIDIYYSRWWYVAYIIYMLLPLTVLCRIRKYMSNPVYAP